MRFLLPALCFIMTLSLTLTLYYPEKPDPSRPENP
jgi:hypothetical protein